MKALLATILCLPMACTTISSTKFSPEKAAAIEKVSQNSNALYDLDEKFKKDKDVVRVATSKNPHSLVYAHKSLQQDKEIVLPAVSRMGILVVDLDIDNPLLSDPDVILAAVKDHYPGAVASASKSLKNDAEFVKQAMTVDAMTLCFVAERFKRNQKFIALFKKQYPKDTC